MNKSILVKIHLSLSALFAPFLLLIAFTGTSYLLSYKGSVETKLVTEIQTQNITAEIIKNTLSSIDPSYTFEYTKGSSDKMITRPTTRVSYEFIKKDTGYEVYKVSPNFLKRIVEVHKGHGPSLLKWLQKILGICLILILITGVMISFKSKKHKRMSLGFMTIGSIILGLFFFLL